MEGTVHVRIIDEAFPADGGAGLFEVNAHDDVKVISGGIGIRLQLLCILLGCFSVMDGARSEKIA